MGEVNRVRDRLHISDAPTVRKLPDDHGFDRIITLGYYDGPGYSCPTQTTDHHVFPDGPHDYADFETAVEVVLDALAAGERLLVHCQAGVSRSATVCAVALAVREGLSFEEAVSGVRAARPKVDPTPELRESARRYLSDRVDSAGD